MQVHPDASTLMGGTPNDRGLQQARLLARDESATALRTWNTEYPALGKVLESPHKDAPKAGSITCHSLGASTRRFSLAMLANASSSRSLRRE